MTTATLITGKVKYSAGKPKDFGHGDRINAVVTPDDGGEDIKIWGKADDQSILSLKRGQVVNLFYDGKSHKLVSSQPAAVATPSPKATTQPAAVVTQELSPEQKRAIAEYISGRADLLKFCWTTASTALEDIATEEESIRCAATTLFIAAQKKFNL